MTLPARNTMHLELNPTNILNYFCYLELLLVYAFIKL